MQISTIDRFANKVSAAQLCIHIKGWQTSPEAQDAPAQLNHAMADVVARPRFHFLASH